jgi:hypothetical protein
MGNAIEDPPAAGAVSDVVTTGGTASADEVATDSTGVVTDVLDSVAMLADVVDRAAAASDVLESITGSDGLEDGSNTASDVLGSTTAADELDDGIGIATAADVLETTTVARDVAGGFTGGIRGASEGVANTSIEVNRQLKSA